MAGISVCVVCLGSTQRNGLHSHRPLRESTAGSAPQPQVSARVRLAAAACVGNRLGLGVGTSPVAGTIELMGVPSLKRGKRMDRRAIEMQSSTRGCCDSCARDVCRTEWQSLSTIRRKDDNKNTESL